MTMRQLLQYNALELFIDITFNVSQCYMTCITFKHPNLRHIKTQKAPLFLGMSMLHMDAKEETYLTLFRKLEYFLYDSKEDEHSLNNIFLGDHDITCTYQRWYDFSNKSSFIPAGKSAV